MFFEEFPKLNYSFRVGDTTLNNVEVLDIFRRVSFNLKVSPINRRPTTSYIPEAGDTAEIIADKFYGDPQYWWLVCLFSNIVNPFNQFPRTGLDVGDNPSTHVDAFLYLEQEGGVTQRSVKKGDYVVVGTAGSGVTYSDPRLKYLRETNIPFNPVSKKAILRVASWEANLLKAGVVGDVSQIDPATDSFIIMENYDDVDRSSIPRKLDPKNSFVTSFGKVLRKETKGQDSLVGFTDAKTGFPVSGFIDIQTRKLSNIYIEDKTRRYQGHTFGNTIIGGFLGTTGNAGNTYNQRYEPVYQVMGEEKINRNVPLGIVSAQNVSDLYDPFIRQQKVLRLLNPEFKDEALALFRQSLRDVRYSRRTFSTHNQKRLGSDNNSGTY
tara:strand:+ start:13465 stop:14604 length:1140 start_codon:yes stop_codon:yes gene_type:complete